MEEVVVIIGDNAYTMTEEHAEDLVKAAKDLLRGRGIYALKHQNIYELRNDQYATHGALADKISEYLGKGIRTFWKDR